MRPSHITRSTDLPCELLMKVIDQLDDEALIQLSMTCKKLHSLALDVLFTRFKLPKDTTLFHLQQPPAHLLRALRIALVDHATSIVIGLNPDTDRLLPDILNLNRIFSRFPTMSMSAFIFPLSSLPQSPSNEGGFDEERWTTEIIRLFDMVLDKSCVCLKVSGDMIPTQPTPTGVQPTNALPPAFSQRLSCEKICQRLRNLSNASKRTILSHIRHRVNPPHHRILQRFHALSSDLFQPQFLNWTTSTFLTSSRTLTTVSFKTDRVPTSTWHSLLPKLTLPSLVSFQVTCDRVVEERTVDFSDVLNFLTRHPSIVDLDLYGLTAPTNNRPWNLLPSLQRLTSYPALIIWLLESACPLNQLNIVSEAYPQPPAFDYNTFNDVLALLPGRAPPLTNLTISFFSVDGVTKWLDGHLSRGSDGPLAALEGITSLEVVSPRCWEGVVTVRMPRFLAQFPGLEHFTYPSLPPNPDMETVEGTFLTEIALTCPGMRKVTIRDTETVDLDSLRGG